MFYGVSENDPSFLYNSMGLEQAPMRNESKWPRERPELESPGGGGHNNGPEILIFSLTLKCLHSNNRFHYLIYAFKLSIYNVKLFNLARFLFACLTKVLQECTFLYKCRLSL